MNLTKTGFKLIEYGINSVNPSKLLDNTLDYKNNILKITLNKKTYIFNLKKIKNIKIIAFGKASLNMSSYFENIFSNKNITGVAIAKEPDGSVLTKIKIIYGGHPVINDNSCLAGEEILNILNVTKKNDFVLFLISGGGSSLVEKLNKNISLEDYKQFISTLLSCGMKIDEINLLRQKLSLIKGGKLLNYLKCKHSLSLIISDVIGDKLEFIASGPTVKQKINNKLIPELLKKYNILDNIPVLIKRSLLDKNIFSNIITSITNTFRYRYINNFKTHHENLIIGSNIILLKELKKKANKLNLESLIVSNTVAGEAKEYAKDLYRIYSNTILQSVKQSKVLLFGGETTVNLGEYKNNKGGRNQEIVLAFANEIISNHVEYSNLFFCSVGSDGIDGTSDAAGAYIDKTIINKIIKNKIDLQKYLNEHRSYKILKSIGSLIITGATGTNVCDFQILMIK